VFSTDSCFVWFVQVKLTKISYIWTLFKVCFMQDYVLLRVQFRRVAFYSGFGLDRFLFYSGFCLDRFLFYSVFSIDNFLFYSEFSLDRFLFYSGFI
jgi:hypothetical protein